MQRSIKNPTNKSGQVRNACYEIEITKVPIHMLKQNIRN